MPRDPHRDSSQPAPERPNAAPAAPEEPEGGAPQAPDRAEDAAGDEACREAPGYIIVGGEPP